MREQTFGVEIETAGVSRERAVDIIAEYFGTGAGYRVDGAHLAKDRKGREWKAIRDGSITAIDGEYAEIVTPILTYDDLEDLQEVARLLRRAGAVSTPDYHCGVHVHVGANGHTAKSLRALANIMASRERLLVKAINVDSGRITNYCRTVNRDFLEAVNRVKPKTMEDLESIWYEQNRGLGRTRHYDSSRYHMLNLHAVFSKGTVEFRLFQFDNPTAGKAGGIHAGQLKAYVQLSLALSAYAKTVRTARPAQPQMDNEKFAMRTWLNRLGLIGEEFKTARELLTRRLDGDAAWRYGRPA